MTILFILLGIALLVALAVLFGPMILLYIFGGIAALIALILLTPVTVDIKLKDELCVALKIWFVKIKLTPKKEKPIKLSDFKIAKFRKQRLKEQKKFILSRRKKKKGHITDGKAAEKPQYTLKENARYALDLVRLAILTALKKFGKHLRISLYHLRVTVGGDEPDKTAITYGYICQGVSYLTNIFDRHLNMKYPGRTENRIFVGADFSSPETKIDLHIAFRIKVWHVASVGLTGLFGYLKVPKRKPKKNKENNPAKAGTEV
ncbi:MAG: hypothetical protein IJY94_00250 [Clostridia bacterium]|nr:hypothetical protein [Clostridia bacterium]